MAALQQLRRGSWWETKPSCQTVSGKPTLVVAPRHATGHRGVVYRIRVDGSRTYVYATGRFTRVKGEDDAVARRDELASQAAHPFSMLAEEWFASKRKLRRSRRERYRGLTRSLAVAEDRPSRSDPGHHRQDRGDDR